MFETNFLVDKGMYSYHVLWNCFKKLSSSLSPELKDYLFRKTASQVYRRLRFKLMWRYSRPSIHPTKGRRDD